jgi:2-phospho-L-lactate guanylyltransferase
MTSIVVLPVKRFGAAKSRLGDRSLREQLAPAMVEDVMREFAGWDVVLVSGEPFARALGEELSFTVLDDPDTGHVPAAIRGITQATARGATAAVLLAGDCPLASSADVAALIAGNDLTILADRHGSGTNGLILTPPGAITPSFGEGSRSRHEQLAADAGINCVVAENTSFALDIDTPCDVDTLVTALRRSPDVAPRTRAALTQAGLL